MMLIQGHAKKSSAEWQGTWMWLWHSSGTNKGRGLSWNAGPGCRSCCSQLSHTTHLNTINLNQGYTEPMNSSTGRQSISGEGAQDLPTRRTRWKKKVVCFMPYLSYILKYNWKITTQTLLRWDSKCHDWERRKQQVDTVFCNSSAYFFRCSMW